MTEKRSLNIHGTIGIGVLVAAEVTLFRRVDPFFSWFYALAWWSYILIMDSLVYRWKGNSLILSRTREFFLLVCWSFTTWLFFEMANLVLQDWYYINVPKSAIVRFFGYGVSYGTVLPAIFETTELLESVGLFRSVSVPKIRVTSTWYAAFLTIGGLFLALPFIFPRYAFPLIWGAFIFLFEPINHRFGAKSLLREWEGGSLRKFFVLLVSGIICGGLWEFWNFWARTKWVYTVPFFEELKLFEMPLLGFLGFPPFAVECYVIYNFISLFRFGRGWEQDAFRVGGRKTSRTLRLATTIAILFFYVVSTRAIDRYTVRSTVAILEDFPYLSEDEREALERVGVHTMDDLAYRARGSRGYGRLLESVGFPPSRLDELIEQARLIELKGLGIEDFLLLEKAGIDSVGELAGTDPKALYQELLETEPPDPASRPPTQAQVKIWIRAARYKTGH